MSTKQIAPPHSCFARKAHNSLFTQSMSLVGNASCLMRDAADICKCVCGHEYTQIQYVIGCIYICVNCYFGLIVLSKHSRATVCKLYEKQIYHSKYEMVKCLCKCNWLTNGLSQQQILIENICGMCEIITFFGKG